MRQFCKFFFLTLTFSPQNMDMNLISDRLSTASIKYLNWSSPAFGRFQNGCNKEVIEPLLVQFWTEIILLISNRTSTARSFDFEITCMISVQIAFHSVQLPLWIINNYHINCGVVQGFPALRKSLTTREKISYFSRVLLGFLKAKQNKGLLCLYDKQNNTWARADMEFNSTSHSFAVLTRELSS